MSYGNTRDPYYPRPPLPAPVPVTPLLVLASKNRNIRDLAILRAGQALKQMYTASENRAEIADAMNEWRAQQAPEPMPYNVRQPAIYANKLEDIANNQRAHNLAMGLGLTVPASGLSDEQFQGRIENRIGEQPSVWGTLRNSLIPAQLDLLWRQMTKPSLGIDIGPSYEGGRTFRIPTGSLNPQSDLAQLTNPNAPGFQPPEPLPPYQPPPEPYGPWRPDAPRPWPVSPDSPWLPAPIDSEGEEVPAQGDQ